VSWTTARAKPTYDLLAPDGSEIRRLVSVGGGSLVHCTLRPGRVTRAVKHRSVEEVWYCIAGAGQLWRRDAERGEVVDIQPGVALSIPRGVAFQFRASSSAQPLEVVIVTMPPWPGPDEAVPIEGAWTASE
jgi:mannose-6-phosphate isomerase-like protein (cupin superfamily)